MIAACRTIGRRFTALAIYGDTTPGAFFLASVASLWALGLALPGDTMTRPVYRIMGDLVGTDAEGKWAAAWTLYALLGFWRVFSAARVPALTLAVNIYGCMIFSGTTAAIIATRVYPVPAAIAADIACAGLAFWILARSGVNPGPGWRRDVRS